MSYKISRIGNREGAIRKYLDANEWWMSEDEEPLATALLQTAQQLDSSVRSNAQLTAEYRQLYKELHSHKPVPRAVIKEEVKELDAFDTLIENF